MIHLSENIVDIDKFKAGKIEFVKNCSKELQNMCPNVLGRIYEIFNKNTNRPEYWICIESTDDVYENIVQRLYLKRNERTLGLPEKHIQYDKSQSNRCPEFNNTFTSKDYYKYRNTNALPTPPPNFMDSCSSLANYFLSCGFYSDLITEDRSYKYEYGKKLETYSYVKTKIKIETTHDIEISNRMRAIPMTAKERKQLKLEKIGITEKYNIILYNLDLQLKKIKRKIAKEKSKSTKTDYSQYISQYCRSKDVGLGMTNRYNNGKLCIKFDKLQREYKFSSSYNGVMGQLQVINPDILEKLYNKIENICESCGLYPGFMARGGTEDDMIRYRERNGKIRKSIDEAINKNELEKRTHEVSDDELIEFVNKHIRPATRNEKKLLEYELERNNILKNIDEAKTLKRIAKKEIDKTAIGMVISTKVPTNINDALLDMCEYYGFANVNKFDIFISQVKMDRKVMEVLYVGIKKRINASPQRDTNIYSLRNFSILEFMLEYLKKHGFKTAMEVKHFK